MLNLVYFWLIDINGFFIMGSFFVIGCIGVIELKVVMYYLFIFVDGNIGRLIGIRVYMFIMVQKDFDKIMFFLYKVLSEN